MKQEKLRKDLAKDGSLEEYRKGKTTCKHCKYGFTTYAASKTRSGTPGWIFAYKVMHNNLYIIAYIYCLPMHNNILHNTLYICNNPHTRTPKTLRFETLQHPIG